MVYSGYNQFFFACMYYGLDGPTVETMNLPHIKNSFGNGHSFIGGTFVSIIFDETLHMSGHSS